MKKESIKENVNIFLADFDNLTRESLTKISMWQIDQKLIEIDKGKVQAQDMTKEEKVELLIKHNNHPFRQFTIKLKNKIDNKISDESIIKTINDMCNGRFLDSIGVPGHSIYSDIILDFCDKLYREKNTCS